MADLLTTVLVVYVVLTVASWRVGRVTRPWIAVGMGGAAIPDLVKIGILVDSTTVEAVFEVPFEWAPLSTLGGLLLGAGVITLAFARRRWRRAYGYLVGGGMISLIVDGLRVSADGRAGPWLYPFTWWRPPTPSLYVTSDVRILVVTLLVSAVVFGVDRRLADRPDPPD